MSGKIKEKTCQFKLMAARDALEVIQGMWRFPIIIALSDGKKRFGELKREITEISPKMLSQELKSLETNKMITRSLLNTMPITVEYELTPLGTSSFKLLDELLEWGLHFREEIMRQ